MKFLEYLKPLTRVLFWIGFCWSGLFDAALLLFAEPLRPAAWVFTALKWAAAVAFILLQRRAAKADEWKKAYFLSRVALFYAVALQGFQHFYGVSLVANRTMAYVLFYLSIATVLIPSVVLYLSAFGKKALLARGVMVKNGRKYHHGFSTGAAFAILDWVDAIVGAFILVMYLSSFVFQCYVIPSGSMENTLLVGDRLISLKPAYGIEPPFSNVKLPRLSRPDRGEIVILHNPRVPAEERQDVGFILGQYLQVLSNAIFKDNAAAAVAEPLVKRVIGLPGERLYMLNDIVYVQTEGSEARALSEPYTRVFANPASDMSVGPEATIILDIDRMFAGMDLDRLEASTRAVVGQLASDYGLSGGPGNAFLPTNVADFTGAVTALATGVSGRNLSRADLDEFFLGAFKGSPSNPYEVQAATVNAWLKLRLLECARDILAGSDERAVFSDETLRRVIGTWLNRYDARNFPPFPAAGYLGKDEWFLMGDNRYSSLDGRHWDSFMEERKLWTGDPSSLTYPSLLDPFAISGEMFFAEPLAVAWPLSNAKALP